MVVVENFGSCNMRCDYCFPEHMWRRQGHRGAMSESQYGQILERAFAMTALEHVDVHFAGGEPLLAGCDWFEAAFRTARDTARRFGKQVTFSLQTNANFLTPELVALLVRNEVNVGVSLDGPPEINEAARGQTGRTLEGLDRLSDALGRRPGIIVTVTRCNALRMPEVIDFLDGLGVALFRANLMGATASWNEHAAPRAAEWARARQDILSEIAARGGRILEFNLSQSASKFVRSVIQEASPFNMEHGCCDMRCPAGRQLMYFDQRGGAYACPRANVSAESRIAHSADPDFEARWYKEINRLDIAMTVPAECQRCPAQFICDYGCHAFNVANGDFFEVNCDATKTFFGEVVANLDKIARAFLYASWREHQKRVGEHRQPQMDIELSPQLVGDLTGQLQQSLALRLARPGLDSGILERRYC